METTKSSTALEKEILELVLKEILEEQQKTNAAITNPAVMVEALTNKINDVSDSVQNSKITTPTVNTKPIEELIQKAVIDLEVKALLQSKITTRKFQILLFPPQDARLFCKIVFGRWLFLLAIMLLITDVYKWGIHWSDNQKEIRQHQLETDRTKRAWNYLYFQKGKGIKRLMDSAYKKTLSNKN